MLDEVTPMEMLRSLCMFVSKRRSVSAPPVTPLHFPWLSWLAAGFRLKLLVSGEAAEASGSAQRSVARGGIAGLAGSGLASRNPDPT